ncbi:hypothetical protein CFS9_21220 [Flavobacterium sp. CFS9]|uniref:Uncharacterized protein n=1 Tax=Flavobacterium sp. CFS9 TaxID=3143118 RepID=A0AAT9H1T8_9FLAO
MDSGLNLHRYTVLDTVLNNKGLIISGVPLNSTSDMTIRSSGNPEVYWFLTEIPKQMQKPIV